ncbi:MAG: sulfatase-like hydrolase/transferase [Rhodobacterales bacterium]
MKNTAQIKNILLLSLEDLNDWIEPLGGHPQAHTPNLSRLAKRSTVFERAYAAAPACSPSRTAPLFGQAPWRTGIYHNRHSWAMAFEPGKQLSIIGQAKKAGWDTFGAGKIFHTGKSGLDRADWTEYFNTPVDVFAPISRVVSGKLLNPLDDFGPISDDSPPLFDARNLNAIKTTMTKGATKKLWAYGTYRPHLPFIVPQRFFDMIKQPVENPPGLQGKIFAPKDFTEISTLPAAARKIIRRGMGRKLFETGEYKDFLHAYLASIAYADFLVGQLLDHLDETGLSESTMIVLWSDHGWQLGEKLAFRKFTLWERALRVPLMISWPGAAAARITSPVSLLDIYPTLLHILGQTPPYPLDGQDLQAVSGGTPGRGYAQSMWERIDFKPEKESFLASSVRTEQYRLILYHDGSMELYNHENDPYEHNNLLETGLGNAGENILHICSYMIDLLPQTPHDALTPRDFRATLQALHPYDTGHIRINS